MALLHPEKSPVLAALLLDRPMCLDCISAKTELSTTETDRLLTVIGATFQVLRTDARCCNCGREEGPVYSLRRSVN